MSLTGALLAVFIQQWSHSYLRATQARHSPRDRARIRTYRAEGFEKWHIHQVTRAAPILIHISLFLFFSGLPLFLFNVNRTVFHVVVTWLVMPTSLSCLSSARIAPISHHFRRGPGSVSSTSYLSSFGSSKPSFLIIPPFSGGTTAIMPSHISAGRLYALCNTRQQALLCSYHRRSTTLLCYGCSGP